MSPSARIEGSLPEDDCVATGEKCGLTTKLTYRQRFLSALHCRPVDYPPVWLMRQAGRVLPEYRALKEKHSFLEMVQSPTLAAEVTLQPIRRFGFDAAILFSDILVISEALGQGYNFRDGGGIQMDFAIESAADIDRLDARRVTDHLSYVSQTLSILRRELGEERALIGFAGSPWTLANFMLEGGSTREFTKAKALFYENPALFNRLAEILTTAVIEFLKLQIQAGADAVQVFDSLGGLLADNVFEPASCRWIRTIVASLEKQAPVIVFSKGTHGNWDALVGTGANVLGLDWTVNMARVSRELPETVGLQGNLDPAVLQTTPEVAARETGRILAEMRNRPGHIFNLGHGVPPGAKLENIESMIHTIRKTA